MIFSGHNTMSRRRIWNSCFLRPFMVSRIRFRLCGRPHCCRPFPVRRVRQVPHRAAQSQRHRKHRADDVLLRHELPGIRTLQRRTSALYLLDPRDGGRHPHFNCRCSSILYDIDELPRLDRILGLMLHCCHLHRARRLPSSCGFTLPGWPTSTHLREGRRSKRFTCSIFLFRKRLRELRYLRMERSLTPTFRSPCYRCKSPQLRPRHPEYGSGMVRGAHCEDYW